MKITVMKIENAYDSLFEKFSYKCHFDVLCHKCKMKQNK